jgi:predicted RNA-binding Zn-ribbon protein involved in translation (DUF1610 family)
MSQLTITEHVRLHLFPQADRQRHDILDLPLEQHQTVLLQREDSTVSHDCGACGAPLLQGCRLDRLPGKVFACGACGAFCIP